MKPFERVTIGPPTAGTIKALREFADSMGIDFEAEIAPRLFRHPGEMFKNDRYQVIRERHGQFWHLSIKPLATVDETRWREFQRIKDELVGSENEGVELYPAAGRLVDTADQYHLWVAADPAFRFPFGFQDRLVLPNQRDSD